VNWRKHLDLAIVALVLFALLAGVYISEKMDNDADDAQAAKSLLNEDGEEIVLEPAKPSRNLLSWITEEYGNPRQRNRVIPKPFEKGVVHLGESASLGGRRPFPEDNAWNQPIADRPVDPMSDILIANIGADTHVHPDFGAGFWQGAPIGIPYYVVGKDQPPVEIVYTAYGDQSDPGPYPIPKDAPIEGHPNEDGDRHVIILDRDNWKLYELFRAFNVGDGRLWRAESGAVFDLTTNYKRPEGWTSADAAGLPIFPGLVRYDEVAELKEIKHALRFTVSKTRHAYIPPASHWASDRMDPRYPPMGMRVRLKANYDISDFPPHAQVILTCLKKYGMILADNGSDWFISGTPDPRWDDEAIRTLKQIQGKDFEVVLMEGMVTN